MWCGLLSFSFIFPVIFSKCIDYATQGTCEDSVCFSSTLFHKEGLVQRLGCFSAIRAIEEPLKCKRLLPQNGTHAICVEYGNRTMCCCNGTEKAECNAQWEKGLKWPKFSAAELMVFLSSLCLALLSPLLLNRFLLPIAREEQLAAEISDRVLFCEGVMFKSKLIFFCLFGALAWFPIIPDCVQHDEGDFQRKMLFLAQVFPYPWLGFPLTTLPFICIIWDAIRFRTTKRNGIPFRLQSMCSVALVVGLVLHLAIYASETLDLWHQQKKTTEYCRATFGVWQAMAIGVFLSIYILAAIVHELWLWRLRRANEKLLEIEANEANNKEFNAFVYDENPMTILETALSNTTVREEDYIDFSPRPFTLDPFGEAVLTISNLHVYEWIAIRILCSIPHKYAIHPSKLVLPPQRAATVAVRYLDMNSSEKRPALMIQWFAVGKSAPPMDATRLWQKPHLRPRSQWKFFVLPIYHEL